MEEIKQIAHMPDAEFLVMQVVWKLEPPITTGLIYQELIKNREWNLSAVQTLLNRLAARGIIETFKKGKNRFYSVIVPEKDYIAVENKSFLDRINGSSITKLVASLHESKGISANDIDDLMKYLDKSKKK